MQIHGENTFAKQLFKLTGRLQASDWKKQQNSLGQYQYQYQLIAVIKLYRLLSKILQGTILN